MAGTTRFVVSLDDDMLDLSVSQQNTHCASTLHEVPRVLKDQVIGLACLESLCMGVSHQQLIDDDSGALIHQSRWGGLVVYATRFVRISSLETEIDKTPAAGHGNLHDSYADLFS
jgi:hypothetical protein